MKRLYPIYINKKSPCYSKDHLGNSGCPAENDIPRFLHLVSLRRFEEAFYVLKKTNPFSGGCGRFCDHPCETACNRAKFDMPVDIKALERFVADWGYKNGLKPIKYVSENVGKNVAVIGSGPSGLSVAYFLAQYGVNVDVFERHKSPGGLLVEGIPRYRYPLDVFEKELNYILDLGVKVHCNENINKSKFYNLASEYDAVVIATGAHKPFKLNIEGEDLENVLHGIEFLRGINVDGENPIKEGEQIGVIGGGYTAFDVARVAVRLKGEPTVIYRRTVAEMTAHPGEVEESKREGVKFEFLLQPVKIEKSNNNKLLLTCQKMKLGPVDESGRRRPVPVKGEYKTFEFDKIVLAIGDEPDLYFVGEKFTIEFPKIICSDLPEEFIDKIFITGDAASGAVESTGMVVRAVGLARKTAKEILRYLNIEFQEDKKRDIAYYNTLNLKYFEKSHRLIEEKLDFKERKYNFKEIVKTVDEDTAVLFAKRCFFCGICIQCDWCYRYSDGSIAKHEVDWDPKHDACFYTFIKEKVSGSTFKSVEACPRSALSVIDENSENFEHVLEQYKSLDEIKGVKNDK
ncbi:FAD-dependent oxidoreductase [Deferribacter thermophilus]|uniref:FAD-dependent oxidoreductase n=1 Tax=Deferribacter thermophilus TaxID=53573 RepID=UPI003C1B9D6D